MLKRLITFILMLILSGASFSESDFPSRPVTLLIGFEQGGTLFTQAVTLAEILSEKLGQPVTLETRAGHGGGTAAAMIASSKSEGYILLFTPSFPLTDYPARLQVSYKIDDFSYIAAISADQHAFVTSQWTPFDDWAGFLDYARQQTEIRYASQNLTDRLIIQEIAEKEGFKVRVIPVSGGAGMAPLILSGDVELAFSGGTHSRYTDSGEMRVLAATGVDRLKHYPEVPSLHELGYDLGMQSVRLIAAPQNTPQYQIDILSKKVKQVINDDRFIHVTENVIRQPLLTFKDNDLKLFLHSQEQQLLRLITKQNSQD
ncbi:tripartite tricarboxylate transporter substrate-binding protein [Nitrincola schmidtii]|uniref:tripartite tricarboxylate transporter substrate-binding protein n=1 Tax=Nitrincola schmidtii TaxID=1730894 RepID=UPI001456EC98|nr:tripartite tricarboxylate transporter substrate-binding protein [Nitrincola schmidtii]